MGCRWNPISVPVGLQTLQAFRPKQLHTLNPGLQRSASMSTLAVGSPGMGWKVIRCC